MPEGDTIYRTAAQLRTALDGRLIEKAESRDPQLEVNLLAGRRIGGIEARGKHLLIHLESGHAIHTHLGMTGSWHVYPLGTVWRKPAYRADLVLHLADRAAVCFTPKTLELLSAAGIRRHVHLTRLGPDLLSPEFDLPGAISRLRRHNLAPIGEAVMNQTLLCGIGNVYKSELLFLERISPFAAVGKLSDEQLVRFVNRARQLLRKNLSGYPRRTRFGRDGQRLWVYGRRGDACLRCGTAIGMRRQGDLGRSTYWCPGCQPANVA